MTRAELRDNGAKVARDFGAGVASGWATMWVG
jgi:hypothetical protein